MKLISKLKLWRNERRINHALSLWVGSQIEVEPTIGGVRVLVPLTE